jgi:CRP-like cAMP-binding protein
MDGEVDIERGGQSLGTRGAGDFIGEIAILEDVPRTATVTAKTPLKFFVLTAQSFRSVVDRHPDVERKVLRALARRLVDLANDPSVS